MTTTPQSTELQNNPLFVMTGLPPFSQIKPQHIEPAVTEAIKLSREKIEQVLSTSEPFTWQNLVEPLEESDDKLGRIWSPVGHLNGVLNSEELRQAYEACLPLLSEYSTWVGQHKPLYQAYQQLADSDEFRGLTAVQQKVIKDTLRDFKLSGIALDSDKQQRYGEISMRLSELGSKFSNNVLDATLGWTKLVTDADLLSGLPQSAIDAAQAAAQEKEQQGYLFTLDIPSYLPVLTYADNRSLREEMYRAYTTRASDEGPNAGKWDNSDVINETVALRHELANLLDFDSFADKSLATKMAETPTQVIEFLEDLAQKSKPQAEEDLAQLLAFSKKEYGATEIEAWDLAYYAEKLKQHTYAISDEELRPYFPEETVVKGLFEVVSRLYGLVITEQQNVDVWHDDVRFYNISDRNGEHRGSFYLDLYARAHKRGGAWMDDCLARRIKDDNELQNPVAYLTCNFNKPVGGKPALFTHDEVVTLFHEFGHGLHHMLTKVDISAVSGINGVPWDAVELPSQFLENWCWQEQALAFISGHYETGEPLPKEMLDKLLAARNYHSAMQMLRQLEFSLFDFRLHLEFDPEQGAQVSEVLDQVRQQYAVIIPPAFNRFQHGFSHIFAGGYAAGYYSYKWAEVLSADAFSKFEQDGIFNRETGIKFLESVLENGGSQEPMDLFKQFMGREPQVDALLRHSGINA
ncbi:oligopeptidase A [Psychrobium sp. 1_MG-2023]|uniref:oligopeptidase A n=1 Tax=Psychrobium sp. 1_MG-2023 TaxID=3062624 RepID=UPI000C33B8DB|nr:oligopeptidase A [Psychrobium sp. 1_MG-2023]MDP2560477.1 oligopeptidase A [Psychrobium sp. 1_MG-2023]PKF57863.1 oligopeptidase A [Alteromonadales bacterium alter-6D02]